MRRHHPFRHSTDVTPLTSKNIVGHRLWLILFDKTAMQFEDLQHAAAGAIEWNAKKTPNVDVLLAGVIGAKGLEVLQDFTTDDVKIRRAVAAFAAGPPIIGALDNDAGPFGLTRICEALKVWPDKKEMLYFASRAMQTDTYQGREAVATCEKAKVTIDPIDARGLRAGRGGLR